MLSRMYPLLFRKENMGTSFSERIEDFEPYRGRTIAKINIIHKDVFTQPKGSLRFLKGVVRLGNTLQPKTRERLIRNQLFFTEGDSLNPAFLISNLQYLYDQALFTEIEFEIVYTENNEIEINVYTRDKFFLKLSGKYASKDKFEIGILDRNLFGTGHFVENTWSVDPEGKGKVGWEGSIVNANILGGFFQNDINWIHAPGQKLFAYQVQRPFIYPLFRYSGGSEFSKMSTYPPKDSVSVKKTEAGAWIARNFDIFEYPRHAYAALSVTQDWYSKRPSSNVQTGMPWQQSFLALGALAFTQSSYHY